MSKPTNNALALSEMIRASAKSSGVFLVNNDDVNWHVVQITFPSQSAAVLFEAAFTRFSEAAKTTVKNVHRKQRAERAARKQPSKSPSK